VDACAGSPTKGRRWKSDGGGLDRGDLVLAEALADNIKSTCERGIAEGSAPSRENGERIAATKDISGLVSSP